MNEGMQVADDPDIHSKKIVAICGGVGGAKLALGLQHLLGSRLVGSSTLATISIISVFEFVPISTR